MSTEPRYTTVKAHPNGDALGESDRLIVDRDLESVVAIVYSPELAELAEGAFELQERWGDAERLELGPTTGRVHDDGVDIRPLEIDLSHGGYVSFGIEGSDPKIRIIRHEVEALIAALRGWSIKNA